MRIIPGIKFGYNLSYILSDLFMILTNKTTKAPVTPNSDATAFVQRSKTMSARCGNAVKYT